MPQVPSRIGIQNLNVDELAIAYELAVSSLKTSRIMRELQRRGASEEQKRDITLAVIELRTPDNEFVIGDRVKFTNWNTGVECEGTITSAEWVNGHLMVYVETDDDDGGYAMNSQRCTFVD